MRRVKYLRKVGFIDQNGEQWVLGDAGHEYVRDGDIETLLRVICERNVGLRSLLYALSAGSMTIMEVSDQQLDTHPELGWSRGETDMALQRVNWLRSMGLVAKRDGEYVLTDAGHDFIDAAVADWAGTEWTPETSDDGLTAGTYETTVHARLVDPGSRLERHYPDECAVQFHAAAQAHRRA